MNREEEILARTFHDRLTVSRKARQPNPDTGETEFHSEIIYEEVPCALSQSGNSTPEREENKKRIKDSFTLFTCPGILLQAGDTVSIFTEAGQRVEGESGRTFSYVSHGETPVMAERIV